MIILLRGLLQILSQSHRYQFLFWGGVLIQILEKICAILPFPVIYFYLSIQPQERPFQGGDISDLGLMFLFLCLLIGGRYICLSSGQMMCFRAGYQAMYQYRHHFFERMRYKSLALFQQTDIQAQITHLTEDLRKIEELLTHRFADLCLLAMTPILIAIGITLIAPLLLLPLFGGVGLGLLCLGLWRPFFMKTLVARHQAKTTTAILLLDYINGLSVMRQMQGSAYWMAKLRSKFNEIEQQNIKTEIAGAGGVVFYRFLVETALPVTLLLLPIIGELDTSMILFLFLLPQTVFALLEAAIVLTHLRSFIPSWKRLSDMMAEPEIRRSKPGGNSGTKSGGQSGNGQNFKGTDYTIRFQNLTFHHQDHCLFRDVSLAFESGKMTALVGTSGAGKSSLLHLIAGLYPVQPGQLLIGGQDVTDLSASAHTALMSSVFQQSYLIPGTIRQNLSFGVTIEGQDLAAQIQKACQVSRCDQFLRDLPKGYETEIGENGFGLSGGQKQRLSIARALVKQAPIILLDEMTSALDVQTQYDVQQGLTALCHGKTVIVVAHRLTTIVQADLIYVMDQGRVVEQGCHPDLLAQKGLYWRLWQAQMGHEKISGS